MCRRIPVLMVVVAAALLCSSVHAQIFFQEDFEGGTAGQTVLDAPYNWLDWTAGSNMVVDNGDGELSPGGNLYITSNTDDTFARARNEFSTPAGSTSIRFTALARVNGAGQSQQRRGLGGPV